MKHKVIKYLTAVEHDLFGGYVNVYNLSLMNKEVKQKRKSNAELYMINEFGNLQVDSKFGLPYYANYTGGIPDKMIAFNKAVKSHDYNNIVHFFINDKEFMRILHRPETYMHILQKYKVVIAPDFSQLVGMPYVQRLYNCYLNRAFAAYWAYNGINVIPNVTWSTPDSYEYSFSGIPKFSTIAINCTGIIGSPTSKYLWLQGYKEAVKRIDSSCIIRYGDKMDGELEDISVYYPNENLIRLRYGC